MVPSRSRWGRHSSPWRSPGREGHGALRQLLRSLTDPSCGPSLVPRPVAARDVALASVAVAVVLGHSSTGLFDTLTPAALAVPLVVLVPAFAEELAWRGFALPRAMRALSALRASLVLAIRGRSCTLPSSCPAVSTRPCRGGRPSSASSPTRSSSPESSSARAGASSSPPRAHGTQWGRPFDVGLERGDRVEDCSVLAALLAMTIVAMGGLRRSGNRRDGGILV